METSLVSPKRAEELFQLIGYDVDKAVAIQRGKNRKDIITLHDALSAAVETAEENNLGELMYIESIIATLLE
ncbi:hypothetical protein KJ654_04490 [Patescibacteria group bacterium]|nr:hypothetical protein [Patescibacteria group bacterium]MBU1967345.1 hypothetical protein [Patescibacteria group bacterium]